MHGLFNSNVVATFWKLIFSKSSIDFQFSLAFFNTTSSTYGCMFCFIELASTVYLNFIWDFFTGSKTYCGYCKRVKDLLKQLGAAYKVIELDEESEFSIHDMSYILSVTSIFLSLITVLRIFWVSIFLQVSWGLLRYSLWVISQVSALSSFN